jgi:hypothetical protein
MILIFSVFTYIRKSACISSVGDSTDAASVPLKSAVSRIQNFGENLAMSPTVLAEIVLSETRLIQAYVALTEKLEKLPKTQRQLSVNDASALLGQCQS